MGRRALRTGDMVVSRRGFVFALEERTELGFTLSGISFLTGAVNRFRWGLFLGRSKDWDADAKETIARACVWDCEHQRIGWCEISLLRRA